jgi:cytochrome P450
MKDTMAEVSGYLEQLISRKLAAPADDLLSRLTSEQIQTGQMTQQELVKLISLLLLAGHETTTNMIALGTLALLRHPAQLTQLRNADDPKLVARAVEELLRYLSIIHTCLRRLALEDIEIAGQVIRAGEGLVIPIETANRDEAVFPRAGMLDIHRDAASTSRSGSACTSASASSWPGWNSRLSTRTLYRRFPTLALAVDPGDIPFKHDGLVYGVNELPVTW